MHGSTKTIEDVARECGIILPENDKYSCALHTCYKCDRQMVVFDWDGSEPWGESEPPKPIPKTIQNRYTKTSESTYWVNVCPFCDAVQGYWYLNIEPDGIFSEIPDYSYFHNSTEKRPSESNEESEPDQISLL